MLGLRREEYKMCLEHFRANKYENGQKTGQKAAGDNWRDLSAARSGTI